MEVEIESALGLERTGTVKGGSVCLLFVRRERRGECECECECVEDMSGARGRGSFDQEWSGSGRRMKRRVQGVRKRWDGRKRRVYRESAKGGRREKGSGKDRTETQVQRDSQTSARVWARVVR